MVPLKSAVSAHNSLILDFIHARRTFVAICTNPRKMTNCRFNRVFSDKPHNCPCEAALPCPLNARQVKTNRAGGLKLHSSPAHLLQQLAPPHCSLSLNFNDRRWVAKWQIESDFFIPPYHLKHHTKTFNLTTWQQRLLDMHRFCWDKWELCKTTHPLPTGVQAQVPGKVDPEILKELAKVVQSLPEPKKY